MRQSMQFYYLNMFHLPLLGGHTWKAPWVVPHWASWSEHCSDLMMGILVPKTCWGNKTAYFVTSSWFFTSTKYRGNFKHNFAIHEHNTRSKYDLHTQVRNTSLFQKSVINMGVKLYKYLLSKITKLENFNCFRKEIKLVLLNNLFYTLEEFYQSKSVW
jgi:hypothetical protein